MHGKRQIWAVVMILVLGGCLGIATGSTSDSDAELAAKVEKLTAAVEDLRADLTAAQDALADVEFALQRVTTELDHAVVLLAPFSLEGSELVLTGVNLHIRSGLGVTHEDCGAKVYNLSPCSGLGNLIIGYNEGDGSEERHGAHNIVLGRYHSYRSTGGFLGGEKNGTLGSSATVPGGTGCGSNKLVVATGGTSGTGCSALN